MEDNPHKQEKYLDFIDIYTALDDNEMQQYREQYPEEVNKMSAFAERFRNQGLEKGLEEGRKKGREEGELRGLQKTLLAQLRLKFGADVITDSVRQRIHQADNQTLLHWLEHILIVQQIDDLWSL